MDDALDRAIYGYPTTFAKGMIINPIDSDRVHPQRWDCIALESDKQEPGTVQFCRFTLAGHSNFKAEPGTDVNKVTILMDMRVVGRGVKAKIDGDNLVFSFKVPVKEVD